ncbi:hypothetical protein VTP01DRAFT_10335 [Rhizomucor pusillus]|uniref:uncharacterized protein n=1 Tax=Rhizomucor pusillus TaxID=4840 RepID=UPI0037420017
MTKPTTDFRNAIIENHWNDPPQTIFEKSKDANSGTAEMETKDVADTLTAILDQCQAKITSGPNKRVLADTTQRINGMLKELREEQISQHVLHSLSGLSHALQAKEWEKAAEIHTKLMTTEYDKHGSWLLGLRRLIDLHQKATSS